MCGGEVIEQRAFLSIREAKALEYGEDRATCGKRRAMASALPSVEALSTTVTSTAMGPREARTDSMQASVASRVLKLTMETDRDLGAGAAIAGSAIELRSGAKA